MALAFSRSIRLLLTRRFGTYWFATLLANVGTWAQQVAQPWLLLQLGASPMLLGIDAFASGAPALLLTLAGGALADRADRRRVIALCQSLQMLCPIAIVALLLAHGLQPWMVIACSLVIGVTDALSMPSFQTIVAVLVSRRDLPTGISLNATQFNLSRILGPALAGLLMASVGVVGAYAVSAASYLPFIAVALWALPRGRIAAAARGPAGVEAPAWRGTVDLLRPARLRLAIASVFFMGLFCSPLVTFCPLLVKATGADGVLRFSTAIAAFGVGGLLGATLLLGVDADRDRRGLASAGAAGFAAMVIVAATAPWPAWLPCWYLLEGLCMPLAGTGANADLHSATPPSSRGRAASLFMVAMRGGIGLGNLAAGALVATLGVRDALRLEGITGLVVLVLVGAAWRRAPAVACQASPFPLPPPAAT